MQKKTIVVVIRNKKLIGKIAERFIDTFKKDLLSLPTHSISARDNPDMTGLSGFVCE